MSRPFGTQFSDVWVSRHCAFGLYRVIHIAPRWGDFLKSPYFIWVKHKLPEYNELISRIYVSRYVFLT